MDCIQKPGQRETASCTSGFDTSSTKAVMVIRLWQAPLRSLVGIDILQEHDTTTWKIVEELAELTIIHTAGEIQLVYIEAEVAHEGQHSTCFARSRGSMKQITPAVRYISFQITGTSSSKPSNFSSLRLLPASISILKDESLLLNLL
ncbi:hypothetical protein EJ05DRAFT_477464 [Pseudovirgaria hyperparasitica]|uniref:Uncharacterized protein n=1 Tax=Pseudovirgaria hyperparasitica TaxID=470096 RepID=A0A6A6W3R5_9PEZI|nr:uncharacterized protein EJ05DRAFT_477464 [Pseudovirgaria hyperparasitica]KAF2757253.1 hypothetical protein EJ05DRAFT_477464 [Pseudovirgaria hyperparasitica]